MGGGVEQHFERSIPPAAPGERAITANLITSTAPISIGGTRAGRDVEVEVGVMHPMRRHKAGTAWNRNMLQIDGEIGATTAAIDPSRRARLTLLSRPQCVRRRAGHAHSRRREPADAQTLFRTTRLRLLAQRNRFEG